MGKENDTKLTLQSYKNIKKLMEMFDKIYTVSDKIPEQMEKALNYLNDLLEEQATQKNS